LYDTQAYIFTCLLLQAYLSMTHTVCKHVKATHTYMYRRFEHVLSKLGRVEKTERLILYLNKLNWFTEMYLTTMSNTQMLSYWDIQYNTNNIVFQLGSLKGQYSREATHRFRTSNNAKSNPEIKGRNSIFFFDMTLYEWAAMNCLRRHPMCFYWISS
jgi:hypothetical protein